MLAANYSTVRKNFKDYLDKASEGETVVILRKNQEVAVIISEDRYNSMLKAQREMNDA